jgi:hypothetical protein
MFRDYLKTRLAVFLAALALPGVLVAGVCLTPDQATNDAPLETGFTVAIQSDQGQGSIDCSAFTGSGGPMFQIDVNQDKTVGTAFPYAPIFWSIPPGAVPEPGADPVVHADIVFIGNSDGSRCTQILKGNARSGYAAAGTKSNKAATLVACSDGRFEEIPPTVVPPVAPVASGGRCDADDADTADEDLQQAINGNGKYDVVIAIGRGVKGDNTAICSDNTVGAQKRCVDRCITPDVDMDTNSPTYYDPVANASDPACTGDGPFYPMRCRACELSTVIDSDPFDPGSPQFCWEQLQKADPDDSNYTPDGSFKKPPGPKSNQVWKVDEYAGSTCYKISGTTDYGYRYAYWVPSGCPN